MSNELMIVNDLKVYFSVKDRQQKFWEKPHQLKAVNGVNLYLKQGEVLGIVGESGCGKSTLAKTLVGLIPVSEGNIVWLGKTINSNDRKQMAMTRKDMQMIFQDPLASLNPRMTVGDIIAEPLKTHHKNLSNIEIKQKVEAMMAKVGLLPNLINRYPHEFSGGQCQRIGIARALIIEPKVIICDEPVSALDVSIQAQVINLLKKLQKDMNLSLIFIAHDLAVVKHISDRVMVMYLGNVVEEGSKDEVYHHTAHPYTKALMSAVPIADPIEARKNKVVYLEGDLPSPIHPPAGCVFRTRCPVVMDKCHETKPKLQKLNELTHKVACLKF